MGKLTKNQKLALSKIEAGKTYTLEEAAAKVKEITFTKFDASLDIDVRLGVDLTLLDLLHSLGDIHCHRAALGVWHKSTWTQYTTQRTEFTHHRRLSYDNVPSACRSRQDGLQGRWS